MENEIMELVQKINDVVEGISTVRGLIRETLDKQNLALHDMLTEFLEIYGKSLCESLDTIDKHSSICRMSAFDTRDEIFISDFKYIDDVYARIVSNGKWIIEIDKMLKGICLKIYVSKNEVSYELHESKEIDLEKLDYDWYISNFENIKFNIFSMITHHLNSILENKKEIINSLNSRYELEMENLYKERICPICGNKFKIGE